MLNEEDQRVKKLPGDAFVAEHAPVQVGRSVGKEGLHSKDKTGDR